MGLIYHGSQIPNLKELRIHGSTHGNYVYATKNKGIAILFSNHIFNDSLLTISRNEETVPYELIERVPGVFDKAFNKDSTIYTVDDETFKDIHTGFDEVVSDVNVPIINEEHIDNIYDEIKKLEEQGIFKLYKYPNKPKNIPTDDSDLLQKEIDQIERIGRQVNNESFDRLILLHPGLLPVINNYIIDNNLEIDLLKKQDIITIFGKYLSYQMIKPDMRFNLDFSIKMIANTYPELNSNIQNMLQVLNASKENKISFMLNTLSSNLDMDSKMILVEQSKKYLNDERSISQIGEEINKTCKNLRNISKEKNRELKEHQLGSVRIQVLVKDGFVNILSLLVISILFFIGILFILKK